MVVKKKAAVHARLIINSSVCTAASAEVVFVSIANAFHNYNC